MRGAKTSHMGRSWQHQPPLPLDTILTDSTVVTTSMSVVAWRGRDASQAQLGAAEASQAPPRPQGHDDKEDDWRHQREERKDGCLLDEGGNMLRRGWAEMTSANIQNARLGRGRASC